MVKWTLQWGNGTKNNESYVNTCKVVDKEQKAKVIQKLLVEKASDLIHDGDYLMIRTPSFIFNVYKLYSFYLPEQLSILNNIFKLPSFCSLTNTYNCENQEITIEVIC